MRQHDQRDDYPMVLRALVSYANLAMLSRSVHTARRVIFNELEKGKQNESTAGKFESSRLHKVAGKKCRLVMLRSH